MRWPLTPTLATIVVSLLLAGCAKDSAQTATTTTSEATSTSLGPLEGSYVALGSSNAAGLGAGPIVDAACGRGEASYPRQVAEALDLELIDATCSGATINNVVDTPQATGDTEMPPQIEAVPPDAALITVTVGGNDVDYIGTAMECAGGCPPERIDDPAERDQTFAALTAELVDMLEQVAVRAPGAEIVLVGHPVVIEDPAEPCPPLLAADTDFLQDRGERLQESFIEATQQSEIQFVDAYGPFAGHGSCRQAQQRWIEGADPQPGTFPWHPNEAGTTAIAELVTDALAERQ